MTTENSESPSGGENDQQTQKKTVSGDDLYRRSSQYQVWSFTSDELQSLKAKTHENGRANAVTRFEEAKIKLQQEKPEVFADHANALSCESTLDLITFDEEQKYLRFFAQQIIQTCAHFKMPTQVRATATAFFRRFYLVNSAMDFHPKNVVFTCVFLAAKSENYFIAIDSFCSLLPKTDKLDILDLEFVVLLSLKFILLVHHAFRPLYGFFLDFQNVLLHTQPPLPDINTDAIGALYDNAKRWLNDHALLSDVLLLFTPPQIALAALYDCDKRATVKYLKRKFLPDSARKLSHRPLLDTMDEKTPLDSPANDDSTNLPQKDHPSHLYHHLLSTIKQCVQVAKADPQISRDECINIDKKCVYTLNPAKLLKKKIKSLTSPV